MAEFEEKYPGLSSKIKIARDAGYTDTMIEANTAKLVRKAKDSGYSDEMIRANLGVKSDFDISKVGFTEMPFAGKYPNLYGVYGALKETGKSVLPWVKYIDPEERDRFSKLTTQKQTRELLLEDLNFAILSKWKPIATGVKAIVKPAMERFLPKTYKVLTNEINLFKKELVPKVPTEAPPVAKPITEDIIQPGAELPKPAPDTPVMPPKTGEVPEAPPSITKEPLAIEPKARLMEKAIEPLPIAEAPAKKPFSPEVPLTEPTVRFDPHKEMAEAGTESMVAKGIKRDPNKLMTEQLVDEWLANPMEYEAIASRYGVSTKEFAGMMREQASSWGRKLGELGREAQKLGKEIPEIGEALTELEKIARTPGVMDYIQSGWKKFSNVWRGMLVTQLSTAIRNAEVQAGRVGLNVLEEGLNAGLQKALGKPQTVHPFDGAEQLFKLFQRNKSLADRVLKEFPKEYDRLFATYMSDIESAGKMGGAISKTVDILNTFNRFQEYVIRRAVFMGKLDQGLKVKGMDLTGIIDGNAVGEIPLDIIKSSVDSSLEFTFAAQPKYGTLGKKFVDFVTSMPGATFVMPFPRFLLNSLKFQFEYSPLGPLKLLSPAERKAFSEGNMQVISRAMLGTAMLGTAWQIRNSKYAGEKCYELSVEDKTVDMRPFNPFASYLFIADVAKKMKDGTLYALTSKDIAMGIFSSNMRAGTGLYALDKILNGITETGDRDKALNIIKQFAGEVAGGFATPFNQFKEFFVGLDDYVVKEKRSESFMGPIKEKIPFAEKTLSPLYSPTHEGPVIREMPAVRQLTGLMIKEKNIFERELDRLGFEYREILPSTGNPEADNLIAKYMGIASQRAILPILKSEQYKKRDDGVKGLLLKELLKKARDIAREKAEEENPELFALIKLEKIPRREKLVIQKPVGNLKEKIKGNR